MKKMMMVLALLLSSKAQAGEYSLNCSAEKAGIKVEINSLLKLNQEIDVDQNLIKVEIPTEVSYASLKLNRDFFEKIDFEVLGNNSSEFFSLKVVGSRYQLKSWQARGDDILLNQSGRITCVVLDPMGRPVK